MSLEDAKSKCEEAYAAYEVLVANKRLDPALPSEPLSNFFERMMASVAKVTGTVAMKPDEAINKIRKSIELVKKLFRASGDDRETYKYALDITNFVNELTDVIEKDWGTRNYEPLTEAIKGGKERLTKVKKDADELATNLGISADLLTAFGKFLGVLKDTS
jgi:hypothetical protein